MPRPNGSQPIAVSKKQSLRIQANGWQMAETQDDEIRRLSEEIHRQREVRHAIEDRLREKSLSANWYGLK